jgi:hypothetical protein
MSLLKFAYVRGAQNALVSSGAIQPYRNELQADLAVKLAALAIEDEAAEEVSDEELAQAMAAMASNAEEDLSDGEKKKLLEASGEGQEELAELIESSEGESGDDEEEMSEEDAREVVAYLKSAASHGQISGVANAAPQNPGNFQTEAGPRSAEAYAHLKGRQGLADPKKNAVPGTAAVKPLHTGVSLDAKTAAAILRKLSADAASGGEANALGGAGMDGSSSDYQTEEDPRKNPAYANVAQGLAKGDSNAKPGTADMKDLRDNNAASDLDISSGDSNKSAAFNYLLAKTAEEVGPFLPMNLTQTDKLAALRTMIGMSQPERAQYIQRIKWAMDEGEEEKEEGSSDEDLLSEKQKTLPKHMKDKIIAEMKEEKEEEKKASYILGQLGLGY